MIDVAPVNMVHALQRAIWTQYFRPKDKPIVSEVYYRSSAGYEPYKVKIKRVKRELLDAGATVYGLLKSETRILPKLLHPHEHVEAVIYGQHNANSAMLVATNERIIYVDKKPMALMLDEVSYEVVSGIQFDIHLFFASVILHTPVKNYNFKFVNLHCAEIFARHIEMHRLERESKKQPKIEILPRQSPRKVIGSDRKWEDMAGYSWLPTEEEERERIQQVVV